MNPGNAFFERRILTEIYGFEFFIQNNTNTNKNLNFRIFAFYVLNNVNDFTFNV